MERYLKILEEHRWRVFIVTAMLLFVLTVFMQIIPLCAEVWQIYGAIKENQHKVENADEWRANAARIKDEYQRTKLQIDELVIGQGKANQLSRILAFVEKAAREHSLCILSVKPQTLRTYERHIELPLQLELTTNFHGLVHFLNALEAATTSVTKVENVKVQSKDLTSHVQITQLMLVVYYLKARE